MKKIYAILILIILSVSFLLPFCYAQEAETSTPDFDGYIVKLSDDSARVLSDDDALDPINQSGNLYVASTAKDVVELTQAGVVEYFEPNYLVELFDVPDDIYYSQQWNLEYINASAAWDEGYTGSGVRIAIVDSGVNITHEDFDGVTILTGHNVLDDSTNVTDELGHGTFVAGVIAAKRDNGIGIAGITDEAAIVPIKCFSDSKVTSASYIIEGIYTAVDSYGCQVVNLSLGLERDMLSLRECVDYAESQGVLIVSAAGNSGGTEVLYPAIYDNVVGVGSVSRNGQVSGFSNHNESVCVVAPGEEIISLSESGNGYSRGSGTSYSVPHISAMAVIAKCIDPDITASEFKSALIESAQDLGEPGYDEYYGYGSVDIDKLIEAVQANNEGTTEYTDIAGHWGESYIEYVTKEGLFNGMSATQFGPDLNMSRAMAVTVLSRMYGGSISGLTQNFSDVPDGSWYASAVAWGVSNGIVEGVGGGRFMPNENVTREQMAVFLYRYAVTYGLSDGSVSGDSLGDFSDAGDVSSWATQAVSWAIENGLINGRTGTTIVPQGDITRAEAAAVISRFCDTFAG